MNDFRKYAGIVKGLLKNRSKTIRNSIAAREFIKSDFDWQKMAFRAASVYRKILSRPVKDKSKFINLFSKLRIGQPAWLEEAERKGRFLKLKSVIKGKFSYGIIQRGKIRIVK